MTKAPPPEEVNNEDEQRRRWTGTIVVDGTQIKMDGMKMAVLSKLLSMSSGPPPGKEKRKTIK